jgi:ankyrin repeat protein
MNMPTGRPDAPSDRLGVNWRSRWWVVPALASVVLAAVVFQTASDGREVPASVADAVVLGDVAGLTDLLTAGADPDGPLTLGMPPIMRAAIRDDAEVVAVLLSFGADPAITDFDGLTALQAAAQQGASSAIEVLLAAGADPNLPSDNGMNALHHAADRGSVGAIRTLVEHGSPIDATSASVTQGHGYPRDIGPTALGIAARADHVAAVSTLLELGADVNALSEAGITPVLSAIFADSSPEVVGALVEAGADLSVTAACEDGCAGSAVLRDVRGWAAHLERTELLPLLE